MFQTKLNLTDLPKRDYNGWADWTTWNCALWINNEQGLYECAKECRDYGEFVDFIKEVYMDKTPDGAKWDEADFTEMQEMMEEL